MTAVTEEVNLKFRLILITLNIVTHSQWLLHCAAQKTCTCLKFSFHQLLWNLYYSGPSVLYLVSELFPPVNSLSEISFWYQCKHTANQTIFRDSITKQNNILLNKLREAIGLTSIPGGGKQLVELLHFNPVSGCSKQTHLLPSEKQLPTFALLSVEKTCQICFRFILFRQLF